MHHLAPVLFAVNFLLTLIDASIAYHKAQRLAVFMNTDPEGMGPGVKRIRAFLPLVVALYSALNCYAYSLRHTGYLAGLALILVADIVLQWHLAVREKKIRS